MRLVRQLSAVAAVALVGSQSVAAVQGQALPHPVLGAPTAVLARARLPVGGAADRAPRADRARPGGRRRRNWAAGCSIGFAMFAAVIANIAFLGGYQRRRPGVRRRARWGCSGSWPPPP